MVRLLFGFFICVSWVFGDSFFISYGHFSDMIKSRDLSSRIDISTLKLDTQNTYAVGALADAGGEVTIYDGKVYISYGQSGIEKVYNTIPPQTGAMLLAVIRPTIWSEDFVVEEDVGDIDFYFDMIEEKALKSGFDLNQPFLFVLDGEFYDILWHVINGENHHKEPHEHKPKLMKKLFKDVKYEKGLVFGVYAKNNQGIFTHPGENYHAHGIFENFTQAGHVDNYSIKKGTILRLAQ